MSKLPEMLVVAGPTAVGKTELALRWAEERNMEILSCDAFCVYRGMDIGTAKPSAEEQARVAHHGIDIAGVGAAYSVAEYSAYATQVLEDLRARGKSVLVTGGSGFYLKSFFSPAVDQIDITSEMRSEVQEWWNEGGLERLLAELRKRNPGGLGSLDIRNPRRVQAALERCMASGLTLEELLDAYHALPKPFADWRKEVVLLHRERADLDQRIAVRVDAMIAAGLADEVAALRLQGLEQNPTAARSIGYRETLEYLDGKLKACEWRDQIVLHTRQLVRKQLTWFRHQLPVDRHLQCGEGVV